MELGKAQRIAESIVDLLKPSCDRIEIAGSIRRRKPTVNDIDIVCIVKQTIAPYLGFNLSENVSSFNIALKSLGKVKLNGPKIIRVAMGFSRHIDLDLYIATPESWATLLLIRTGSVEHNIRLCMRAKNMGMKLHADGSGLFKLVGDVPGALLSEERIAGESEESIFEALGLSYEPPERRD